MPKPSPPTATVVVSTPGSKTYVLEADYPLRRVTFDATELGEGEATVTATIRFRNSQYPAPAQTVQPQAGGVSLSGATAGLAVQVLGNVTRQLQAGGLTLQGRPVQGSGVIRPLLLSGAVSLAGKTAVPTLGPGLAAGVVTGDHSYRNYLLTLPTLWKEYSLRDAAQLAAYHYGDLTPLTYDPASDTYATPQDGAKLALPPYVDIGTRLHAAMTASQTMMPAFYSRSGSGVTYKIDNEVLAWVSNNPDGTKTVARGAHGTTPAAHSNGAIVLAATNAAVGQTRLPMGTEFGHKYLITWDAWFGAEFRFNISGLTGHKMFQFAQNTGDGILGLEVRNRYQEGGSVVLAADEVATADMRAYIELGPGILNEPIRPKVEFRVKAAKWTRYWIELDGTDSTWHYLSMWMADETRAATKLLDRIPFGPRVFAKMWIEFATSNENVLAGRPTLVGYIKNVVMLKDQTFTGGGTIAPQPSTRIIEDTFTNEDAFFFQDHIQTGPGAGWRLAVDTCAVNAIPFQLYGNTGPHGNKVAIPGLNSINTSHPIPGGWSQPQNCRRIWEALPEASKPYGANTRTNVTVYEDDHGSSGRLWGLIARKVAGQETYYGCGWYTGIGSPPIINPNGFLFKVINGTPTILTSGVVGVTENKRVTFTVDGDTLTMYVDDVQVLQVAGGNAISAAGYGGWFAGNVLNTNDEFTEGGSLRAFSIDNL